MWTLLALAAAHAAPAWTVAPPKASKGPEGFDVTPLLQIDDLRSPVWLQVLATSGQPTRGGDLPFGSLFDVKGHALSNPSGTLTSCHAADFTALWRKPGGAWGLLSHFECVPGGLWWTALQPRARGFKATSSHPIDIGASDPLWLPCAGATTGWNTLLSAEEYEPEANLLLQRDDDPSLAAMSRALGAELGSSDPYRWGWMVEVDPSAAPDDRLVRHEAMGRFSHEIGVVMPDRRTVFLTDDHTNGIMALFVADEAGDLSSGTLYAARFRGMGQPMDWVSLGRTRDEDVREAMAAGLSFRQLFTENVRGCSDIVTAAGRECLKPTDELGLGEAVVNRLETRRAAALMGATSEWRKMEGAAFDPATKTLHVALSELTKGATKADPTWDLPDADHLQFEPNVCGGVMGLQVAAGRSDTTGAPIDSAYVPTLPSWTIRGLPTADGRCEDRGIANPDNLAFLPALDMLVIAEDTGRHERDTLWALHTPSGTLWPLAQGPAQTDGDTGEWTGIGFWQYGPGQAWLSVSWQNGIWGWMERDVTQPMPASWTGLLGPFPVSDQD